MTTIDEGNLRFEFEENLIVLKYDESNYYKKRFQNAFLGSKKAVDFVVVDLKNKITWLVEVKDFSAHPRSNDGERESLEDEITRKVRDTLLGLFCGSKVNGNQDLDSYQNAIQSEEVYFVLHLELKKHRSKTSPNNDYLADLKQELSKPKKLGILPRKPRIVDRDHLGDFPWIVTYLDSRST